MTIKINNRISAADYEKMHTTSDQLVEMDCTLLNFFTSKEISQLLIIVTKYNKKIILINTNDHIKETIRLLKLDEMLHLNS